MNFIRDLHQESFHTNLDPYTNIQSQFDKSHESRPANNLDSYTVDQNLTNICFDKLHEPRVSNNLDSYTIGESQSDFMQKSECLDRLHEPNTFLHKVRLTFTNGCLLYTSPSPRDRG